MIISVKNFVKFPIHCNWEIVTKIFTNILPRRIFQNVTCTNFSFTDVMRQPEGKMMRCNKIWTFALWSMYHPSLFYLLTWSKRHWRITLLLRITSVEHLLCIRFSYRHSPRLPNLCGIRNTSQPSQTFEEFVHVWKPIFSWRFSWRFFRCIQCQLNWKCLDSIRKEPFWQYSREHFREDFRE